MAPPEITGLLSYVHDLGIDNTTTGPDPEASGIDVWFILTIVVPCLGVLGAFMCTGCFCYKRCKPLPSERPAGQPEVCLDVDVGIVLNTTAGPDPEEPDVVDPRWVVTVASPCVGTLAAFVCIVYVVFLFCKPLKRRSSTMVRDRQPGASFNPTPGNAEQRPTLRRRSDSNDQRQKQHGSGADGARAEEKVVVAEVATSGTAAEQVSGGTTVEETSL